MRYQVTIPETLVTLETTSLLPEGTTLFISLPVKGLPVTQAPDPAPITEVPEPAPVEAPAPPPVAPVIPHTSHNPIFDRKYDQVQFRNRRFDTLGKAPALGLSDSNWTIVLNVRFINFENHIRVIGSATVSGAGSSLQIGALKKDGFFWVDTFQGAMTGDTLELNRWYELAISHNRAGEEKLYIDKKLNRHSGNIPVFKSNDDIYVGRWGNDYFDFDLSRVRIYPLLSDSEIQEI